MVKRFNREDRATIIFALSLIAAASVFVLWASLADAQVWYQPEANINTQPINLSSLADCQNYYAGKFQRGFYSGCSNSPPTAQATLLASAASSAATFCAANPCIFLTIGYSNSVQKAASVQQQSYPGLQPYGTWSQYIGYGGGTSDQNNFIYRLYNTAGVNLFSGGVGVALMNCAFTSITTPNWTPHTATAYVNCDNDMIANASGTTNLGTLSDSNVVAVWAEVAYVVTGDDQWGNSALLYVLPNYSSAITSYTGTLVEDIGGMVRSIKARYPNCQLVFISPRENGQWCNEFNKTSCENPEPYAHDAAFAVKWTVNGQIAQNATEVAINTISSTSNVVTVTLTGNYATQYQAATTGFQITGASNSALDTACSDTNTGCAGVTITSSSYNGITGLTTIVAAVSGSGTATGTTGVGHVSIAGSTHDGIVDTLPGGLETADGQAPAILYGPYYPNQYGSSYFAADGTHEVTAQEEYAAGVMLSFFAGTGTCSPYASPWLLTAGHC